MTQSGAFIHKPVKEPIKSVGDNNNTGETKKCL